MKVFYESDHRRSWLVAKCDWTIRYRCHANNRCADICRCLPMSAWNLPAVGFADNTNHWTITSQCKRWQRALSFYRVATVNLPASVVLCQRSASNNGLDGLKNTSCTIQLLPAAGCSVISEQHHQPVPRTTAISLRRRNSITCPASSWYCPSTAESDWPSRQPVSG